MTSSKKTKFMNDLTTIMKTIHLHEDRCWIHNAFIKGPPQQENVTGFKYCTFEGGPDNHWSEKEANGIKFIADFISDLGYKNEPYNIFLKVVRHRILNMFKDNEGKCHDIRNGFGYTIN
tara:strand:+ start:2273 stop:2629 length:357 start_codon:yes stop_codon:yes gene_type:complete